MRVGLFRGGLGHPDERGTEQPIAEGIAGLHDLNDRSARMVGAGNLEHRLMEIRVEPFALGRDLPDPVFFEGGQ